MKKYEINYHTTILRIPKKNSNDIVVIYVIFRQIHNLIKMQIKICILISLLINLQLSIYVKQIINSQSALCLDGSPSAIFYSKGDPQRILIHFESGGWCGQTTLEATLQSCYQTSLTSIGSSKKLPQTMNFSFGILSDVQPNFFINWTRIFFNYCDGSGHQGSTTAAISYKNSSLYFRGANITIERFDYLQKKYGLYSRTKEVVLSGASAGGLAVYFWGNYLGQRIINAKYWLIADSGICLNSANFTTGKYDLQQSYVQLMKLSNQQLPPPTPQCLQKFPNSHYRCVFAENLIPYIKYPLFVVQSLYDSWAIQYILNIGCAKKYQLCTCNQKERQYIEQYHQNMSKVLNKIKDLPNYNGYWANGCVYHGYTFFGSYNNARFRIPSDSAYSIDYSITQWLTTQKQVYKIDQENWPANSKCSNFIGNNRLKIEYSQ